MVHPEGLTLSEGIKTEKEQITALKTFCFPSAPFCFCGLHHLHREAAHGLRYLILFLLCCV